MRWRRTFWLAAVVVSAVVVAVPGLALAQPDSDTHHDWSQIKNTYWYVTPEDLPAIRTDLETQQHQVISDQTVWHIQEYTNGYFWGRTVVQLSGSSKKCMHMVGSITPDDNVQITFTYTPPSLPPALSLVTNATGRAQKLRKEWKIEMQMTTGFETTLTTHWAYMRQCKAGEECNQNLPGVNIPLQTFLAGCE